MYPGLRNTPRTSGKMAKRRVHLSPLRFGVTERGVIEFREGYRGYTLLRPHGEMLTYPREMRCGEGLDDADRVLSKARVAGMNLYSEWVALIEMGSCWALIQEGG